MSQPGAFDDFAIFEATDLDPAMTYAGWNNANAFSGKIAYTRNWSIFYPPVDYPVSDGTNIWNRAAYMAMGHEFENVPTVNGAQNMTLMQAEMLPLAGVNGCDEYVVSGAIVPPGPVPYDTPRSIHVNVKPTRLNYCPNPSFETSLNGWTLPNSAIGTPSIVQQHNVKAPVALETDAWSMLVTAYSAAEGAAVTVPGLFVGETYTASAWVQPGTNTADIAFTAGQFIGGTGLPPDLVSGTWVQTSVTFTATASTMVLELTPVLSSSSTAAFPLAFYVDCVLIEEGEIVNPYFDGNFGTPDWIWGGTANLSCSFWYENMAVNQEVIKNILANHTPLGITPALPLYGVAPSQ